MKRPPFCSAAHVYPYGYTDEDLAADVLSDLEREFGPCTLGEPRERPVWHQALSSDAELLRGAEDRVRAYLDEAAAHRAARAETERERAVRRAAEEARAAIATDLDRRSRRAWSRAEDDRLRAAEAAAQVARAARVEYDAAVAVYEVHRREYAARISRSRYPISDDIEVRMLFACAHKKTAATWNRYAEAVARLQQIQTSRPIGASARLFDAPCPCWSGRRFAECHGRDLAEERAAG